MIHYDNEINATTFFRPQLRNVINQITNKKWEKIGTLKALFYLVPNNRINTWAYSYKLFVLSYLLMFTVGFLGIYAPYDLFLILFPFLLWASDRNILFNVLAHGVALGFIVSISPTLFFIRTAFLLFLILRLLIDIPALKSIKNFKLIHDYIGVIYMYGFNYPLIVDKDMLACINYLKKAGISEGIIISAYVFGHYVSKDEEHEPKIITNFITDLLREGSSD